MDDGGIIILTSVPYLMIAESMQGEMNEWELSILVKPAQRAASVVRAYINGASTDFFEKLFDELQRVKIMVTGKPMPLKKFIPGRNLEVMNVDMDGAQIIGICRSGTTFRSTAAFPVYIFVHLIQNFNF
ncbi:hypothetical protein B0H14DRAFT_3433290 [Mycena olivaceomarginata]|nr:hypothetical protein B0H14DRAFT_3433290 [Mycena olivaceomarginata]